ncbi:MAG: hypothetical protein IJT32_06675 [Lachnospiraceae bacterium]|nr:hypothetical protein [Lachnospiraceae bacterium]
MSMFYEGETRESYEYIPSVTTGVVKQNHEDEHPGMVKVDYFLGQEGKNVSGWVPVVSPYAYNDCGLYLLPEVGAEVVIAFNMGDRNCPMVIGSLWNTKNAREKDIAKKDNPTKRFKTKGGSVVEFSDEKDKEKITIQTPKETSIKIEDENETVTVADKDKKNSIIINIKDGSVSIKADKKVEMETGSSKVTLDSSGVTIKGDAINVEASNGLTLKGTTVKVDGTQTTVSGSSKTDVTSSGVTSVKGSMVKLN